MGYAKSGRGREGNGIYSRDGDSTISDPGEILKRIATYYGDLGLEEREGDEIQNQSGEWDWDHFIMRNIPQEELKMIIRDLKNGKAEGWDEISNEFIKYGGEDLRWALTKCFNKMLEVEWIPEEWAHEKLKMLHKGKSKQKLDNYRGIAITSNVGKLFTRIIAGRISVIAEDQKWFGETQAAFRKGRSTQDHIFTLMGIMAKAKKQKTKLHLAFIDLRKAYDRVWREGLWKCLENRGIKGKSNRIIQKLYEGHKRKISTIGGSTDWVDCGVGVKQGCVLSPILFAIYVAEIGELYGEEDHPMEVGGTKIPAMLFADDLVLISKSKVGLEKMVGKTQKFMRGKKLEINFDKTEIMNTGRNENNKGIWVVKDFKNEHPIGVIKETEVYRYLGIRLKKCGGIERDIKKHKSELKRKIALTQLTAVHAQDPVWAAEAMWKMKMRPTALYATEVVPCTKKWVEEIEKAENDMGRYILGTSKGAPIAGIRGELGWPSVQGEIWKRKLCYRGKILKMEPERWPKIVLEDMGRNGYGEKDTFQWKKEIKEASEAFEINLEGMDGGDGSYDSFKRELNTKWWAYEEKKWQAEKEVRNSMKFYCKKSLRSMANHLRGTKAAKTISRFRMGDIGLIEGKKKEGCPICKINFQNGVEHVLLRCTGCQTTRGKEEITEKVAKFVREGKTEEEALGELVGNIQMAGPLMRINDEWEKKCKVELKVIKKDKRGKKGKKKS